ncbi:aldehyde dehydrogenase family protein [Streptomyces sp. F001]|nr:aldehyde dehydrogenase family protein [Streptomyces sp. F001]
MISPRSEQRIGRVPAASKEDIDSAVAAARHAFDAGEWPRLTRRSEPTTSHVWRTGSNADGPNSPNDHRGARLHPVPVAGLTRRCRPS